MHSLRPVEWVSLHPLSGTPIALVRLVHLGPAREPYYRAVTADRDPAQRQLLGYWATPDLAETAVQALYEQQSGEALTGGGQPPRGLAVPPMKPPPATDDRPAVPSAHATRR